MLPVFDIVLVVLILAFFVFLGYHFRIRNNASTPSTYFLAQRQMSILPAALSITVSLVSSSALTLIFAEIFIYGCPFGFNFLPNLIGSILVSVFVVHRFYDTPFISAYHFLEHRFSKSVRVTNSVIFVLSGLINSAGVCYAASIAIEVLTEIPFWISTLVSGLLCTAYSTLGGIRAVIWTDVCQACLMYLFYVFIIIKGFLTFENFGEFWQIISTGNRADLSFTEGPRNRCTMTSLGAYYIVLTVNILSVSQYGVQRWKCVKSIGAARKTVVLSGLFFAIFYVLLHSCGLVLYGFYKRCSEIDGPIPTADKVSLYFVLKELSSWPGVLGLCMVGVFSGALSTMSSFLNSMAAVTLEDFIKACFHSLSARQELTLSKLLSMIYGLIIIALTFVVAQSKAVLVVQFMAVAVSIGPPLGTFLLAVWTKRTNALGAGLGLTASVALITWISLGSFIVGNLHDPLVSANQTCYENTTSIMQTIEDNIRKQNIIRQENDSDSIFLPMYRLSFYWLALLGFGSSAVLGYLFSICYEMISKLFGLHKSEKGNVNYEMKEDSLYIFKQTQQDPSD